MAIKHFPNIDREKALARPILYSNWLSKNYIPVRLSSSPPLLPYSLLPPPPPLLLTPSQVGRDELRDYTKARLKVFYEEELDVPLVLFNEVLPLLRLLLLRLFLLLLPRCWTTC